MIAAVGFDWQEIAGALHCEWYACGSRVTNPEDVRPDSDFDYCILVPEFSVPDLLTTLPMMGFDRDGDERYPSFATSPFESHRRGEINLILTNRADWYEKHQSATFLCYMAKADKPGRIEIFRSMGI